MRQGPHTTLVGGHFLPFCWQESAKIFLFEPRVSSEKIMHDGVGFGGGEGTDRVEQMTAGAQQGGHLFENSALQFDQLPDIGRPPTPAALGVAAQHAKTAARRINEDPVKTLRLKKSRFFSEIPTAGFDVLSTDTVRSLVDQFDALRIFFKSNKTDDFDLHL
mgnify:CR=1 FL=1